VGEWSPVHYGVNPLAGKEVVIVSEHVPMEIDFPPNWDKRTGAGIRLPLGSGVVLTEKPFFLRVKSEAGMCSRFQSLAHYQGQIKTTLYELAT
jgi:hypothetical protein